MAVAVITEGDYVLHPQLGIGTVALAGSDEVLVTYDEGQEEIYTYGRSGSLPIAKLSPEGFYLWRRERPEELREAFASRPLDVVVALKNDLGNVLSPAVLKRELAPLLEKPSDWDKAFTELIAAAAAEPRFNADKKQGITYRGELNEIAGELNAKFRAASSLKEKIRACKEMMKMEERGIDMEENRESAIGFFYGTASNRTNQFGARIESLLFLKILAPECYEPLSAPLIEELSSLNVTAAAEAVAIITDSAVRKELLDLYKDCQHSRFIEIAATLTKRFRKTQRDWVLDTLLADKSPQFITTIIQATLDDIPTNTQPFIWVARTLIHHPDHIADLGFDRDDIIRAFFKTLANIHITTAYSSRGDEDAALSREEVEMLALLNDRKPLIKFLKGQKEPEFTHMFAALYIDCSALSDETKNEFFEVLRKEFPDIDFKAATIAQEESLALTREAHGRFKEELADLIENKIPINIKAIQAARELGDLSENAEYHAAREKQSFLIGRKHQLERMLENATIID